MEMDAKFDVSLGWQKWRCKPEAREMDVGFEIPLGVARWTNLDLSLPIR
jgi:hypothetical protein